VLAEDGQTVSGSLEYGIHHNSEWHYDFVMHLLMVREDMAIDTQLEGQARLVGGGGGGGSIPSSSTNK